MGIIDKTVFDKCVEVKLIKDGTMEIHCKLGFWSVSGTDETFVQNEALRYWIQYFMDGEYEELLSKQ